jgi:uncharacterized protein YggE
MFVLATILMVGCQSGVSNGVPRSSVQQTGIWVTGQGKISAAPDIATIDLGVSAQAKTVSDAQNQAAGAMTKVVAALTAGGVAQKDIQTRYFNVQAVTHYDPKTGENVQDGFLVTNTVSAKLRDLPKAGAVIDSAIEAGGDLTRVNSLAFTIEDPIRYQDQAIEKAMADARDKAKSLADLAGVRLGKATYISTSGAAPVSPTPIAFDSAAKVSASATPISAGELDITATVQLVYSIR